MKTETPIINILTYRLPYALTNQIYNEFQNRLKESLFLIDNFKTYSPLKDSKKAVELILSISIFHKRVITNLDGAVKFYGTVTKISETSTIRIGNYNLTGDERNKMLAVVLNFNKLLNKFSIPQSMLEYYETRDLLKKLISLKSELKYADNNKRKRSKKGKEANEDFLPF